MDFDEWIRKEKQSVSDIAEEIKGIESKIYDYALKRVKEKFPDAVVEKKAFSKGSFPLMYFGSLRVITGKTFYTNDKRVMQFLESGRGLEGIYSDENPAERHLIFDPIYKAMIKEHEALEAKHAGRNTLLVHAGDYEKQRAWLEAQLVHKTELAYQAKRIQDKLAKLEISINSHMENYTRGKEAYQQLQAKYSDARG